MSQSQPFWVLAGALVAFWLPSCRCSGPEPDRNPDASDPLAGCRSACAAYAQARCPGRDALTAQSECVQACAASVEISAQAGCAKVHDAYFECVAKSSVDCSAVLSAPGVALERAEGVAGCTPELGALERCTAPCRNVGSTHLGEATVGNKVVLAELTRAGCSDCSKEARPAAPPGSPCTAARVCQEHCCACGSQTRPSGPGRYRARACVDGACATSEVACALTPETVRHSPCAREPLDGPP